MERVGLALQGASGVQGDNSLSTAIPLLVIGEDSRKQREHEIQESTTGTFMVLPR